MKKGVCRLLSAAVLATTITCSVFAEWVPSKTQQEIISGSGAIIKEESLTQETPVVQNPVTNNTVSATPVPQTQVVTEVPIITGTSVPQGVPVTATGHAVLSKIDEPMIKVTPLSVTQSANSGVGDGLHFNDRNSMETDSGLTYLANEKTNLVYKTVQLAQDTSDFLTKFNGDTHNIMQEMIQQKIQTQKSSLQQKIEQAEQAGDLETVDKLQTMMGDLDHPEYNSVNRYAPFDMFDISITDALRQEMGSDGRVRVNLELNGIHDESDLIALHFYGEIEDTDQIHKELEENFENALLDLHVEVLDVEVENGIATIELSTFSPVMLMMRQELPKEDMIIDHIQETVEEIVQLPNEMIEDAIENDTIGIINFIIVAVIVLLVFLLIKKVRRN